MKFKQLTIDMKNDFKGTEITPGGFSTPWYNCVFVDGNVSFTNRTIKVEYKKGEYLKFRLKDVKKIEIVSKGVL